MDRYAITFGENAIIHVGSKEVTNEMRKTQLTNLNGFTVKELEEIAHSLGNVAEIVYLNKVLPFEFQSANEAAVLVIRGGANLLLADLHGADKLLMEQKAIDYDKKYWNTRTKRTNNKRARYNIVFGDEDVTPSDDYQQYSVKAFKGLPNLQAIREMLPKVLGPKAEMLCAEGNHYYEAKSYIGFHGDAERKIVICLSLGKNATLRYCWRMPHSSNNGIPIDIQIGHGDIYIMSEKATGNDWKKTSKVRVVHAAQFKF